MNSNARLLELFDLYYQGKASDEEVRQFFLELESIGDTDLSMILKQKWESDLGHEKPFDDSFRKKFLEKLSTMPGEETPVVGIKTRRFWIMRAAAAAVVIILVTVAGIMIIGRKDERAIAKEQSAPAIIQDVQPASDKALLTLADGSTIALDSAPNGAIASQAGITVNKSDGQLSYSEQHPTEEVLFNAISTPRGGQYQLVLSDGTKVWLNAGSFLRFPTTFPGNERRVELKGEGYFEVAHNAAKPFHVNVLRGNGNDYEIQVLGTHFNTHNYSDEEVAKTTLIEGRVKVKNAEKFVYLNPGQQAVINNSPQQGAIRVDHDVDVEQQIAWKNGLFIFDHSDLNKILREFSRWYDVEVEIQGTVPDNQFFGIVSRKSSLASVMKALRSGSAAAIDYRIEGKKLIVHSSSKK